MFDAKGFIFECRLQGFLQVIRENQELQCEIWDVLRGCINIVDAFHGVAMFDIQF